MLILLFVLIHSVYTIYTTGNLVSNNISVTYLWFRIKSTLETFLMQYA